jgi:sulfofructose kinase
VTKSDSKHVRGTYVGAGWLLSDTVVPLRKYPAENEKVSAASVIVQAGGPVARALLQLARFGDEARFVSAVGDDETGSCMVAELKAAGIDVTRVSQIQGVRTRLSQVWLAEDTGSRTSVHSTSGPEPPDGSYDDALERAVALLLDGRHLSAVEPIIRSARERNLSIAIDLGSYKRDLLRLLRLGDILVGPRRTWESVAMEIGAANAERAMMDLTSSLAVMTDGPRRISACAKGELFHHSPQAVRAVDSNGAGDVFFGSLVWAVHNDYGPERAVAFASAAASLKCRSLGNAGLPSLAAVRAEQVVLAEGKR